MKADLAKVELTTTAVHAELVLKGTVSALKSYAAHLLRTQGELIAANAFGEARYTGAQIDKALMGAFDAQHSLKKLTSQGEKNHEND